MLWFGFPPEYAAVPPQLAQIAPSGVRRTRSPISLQDTLVSWLNRVDAKMFAEAGFGKGKMSEVLAVGSYILRSPVNSLLTHTRPSEAKTREFGRSGVFVAGIAIV